MFTATSGEGSAITKSLDVEYLRNTGLLTLKSRDLGVELWTAQEKLLDYSNLVVDLEGKVDLLTVQNDKLKKGTNLVLPEPALLISSSNLHLASNPCPACRTRVWNMSADILCSNHLALQSQLLLRMYSQVFCSTNWQGKRQDFLSSRKMPPLSRIHQARADPVNRLERYVKCGNGR